MICSPTVRLISRSGLATAALLVAALILLLLVCAAAAHAGDGSASGSVTIDGSALTLTHAYGMVQPNTFDEQKNDIAILITSQPLPADALNDLEDLMDATRKQRGWVFFKINAEGKPIYEVIDHPALGQQRLMMSGFTNAAFTPQTLTNDRAQGKFETSKEADFMDHRYKINVSFQTSLLQAKRPEPLPDAKTGTLLPAGGGDPGKAYHAYLKAIRSNDIAGLRKTLSPDKANLSDEELKEGLGFLQALVPKNLKINKGYAKGDRAVLYVSGTADGEKQYGAIEMRKISGDWKVVFEKWSNSPPKQ